MKKLHRHIIFDSMMSRMLIFVILIVLFTTLMLSILGNFAYSGAIRDYAYQSTAEMQKQVQVSIDYKIQTIADSLKILGAMDSVQGYLRVDADKEPQQRLMLESVVRELVLKYSETYGDYLNIVLVSERGQYLSNDSYRIRRTPLSQESWYEAAVRAEGRPVISSPEIGRNLISWKNYSTDNYISISQMVTDEESGACLGVLLIDWNLDSIKSLVRDITLGETGFVFVMDDNGRILYTPENKIVHRIRPEWFQENKRGSSSAEIQGKSYNLIYNQSQTTSLTTVGVYDTGKTIEGISNMKYSSIFLALLTIVMGSIWAFALSASFTKPIKKLSKLMIKTQTGDFTVRFEDKARGEIAQLGNSFNAMIDHTNHLLKLVYKEQKDKREAEMKILQEQIKPHFLYNTLDTIQWMAKKYQARDIVEIVLALAQFFRISLSRGKEYITLEKEFTMVRSYLDIQKYRYEGMFEYEAFYEEELGSSEIIKLLLQPIIENALYHGIKESELEQGTIWIRALGEGEDTILIVVEDDGVGISAARSAELKTWMDQRKRPPDAEAFGVLNVSDRIKMAYGEGYGLTFRARAGGGTRVEIRIGRCRKGERDVENFNSR